MRNIGLLNTLRIIGLLLFQVLILNQIQLHGFISLYIYPLGILLLPFNTPRWLVLLAAFAAGLFVDIFTNSPGLHAGACVFMGYARQWITTLNSPIGDYNKTDKPRISSLGLRWFIVYSGTAILLHHLFYFSFEVYKLSYIVSIFYKSMVATVFSMAFMILYEYLFFKVR